MFQDLRADLGTPELPIVVGQLGQFVSAEKHPHVDTVRSAIKEISKKSPHVSFADSVGLIDKGDKLHFNSESQTEFGKRYAKVMLKLQEQ